MWFCVFPRVEMVAPGSMISLPISISPFACCIAVTINEPIVSTACALTLAAVTIDGRCVIWVTCEVDDRLGDRSVARSVLLKVLERIRVVDVTDASAAETNADEGDIVANAALRT